MAGTALLREDQSRDLHLPLNEIMTSAGDRIFDFCESEMFQEATLQSSEVASSSNGGGYDEQSSYADRLLAAVSDEIKPPSADRLNVVFDEDQIENDISVSIDFTPSSPFQSNPFGDPTTAEAFDAAAYLQNQLCLENLMSCSLPAANQYAAYDAPFPTAVPFTAPLQTPYEEECFSYMRRPLIDPMIAPFLPMAAPFSGFPGGGLMVGADLSQELEYHGENGGLYLHDNFTCSNDLQTLSNEGQQQLIHGGPNSNLLAAELSSPEDLKVGKLSAEERKRKIHRYMKKRNERNFTKKIKYACRKTLADSRPRVRGRFAKNDELGELTRSNHEEDTDEDMNMFSNSRALQQRRIGLKKEVLDSADILAGINGMPAVNWVDYPIKPWL